ncbi:ABC transporter permease [Oscillibacter hominis]|uniref:ABC transporter permease n=1 Tax=Oscillibacter hominis TaxID=2763056 RepID=A0A7G9B4B0_9FIRM|nr:ABC transporter permease [Oscillibacter hominis]QNL44391.1 ABC transporter permease [Oscillibacter hominis]
MSKRRNLIFGLVRGLAAICIALLVATVLIFICAEGGSFSQKLSQTAGALHQLLIGPAFRANGSLSIKNLCDILASMIPTIFTGLSVCVMFSANQFNLGGEGGAMLGAFVAALCAIYLNLGAGIHVVVCILAGALACGAMMLIPALLKVKLDVSEMVCSLMLNYVVMYFIKYMVNSHLADKSKGQIQTFPFQPTAQVPQLVENGSKLSWGFVVAILFVVLTALFMYRTRWGYAIRMIGINKDFAMYSGMKVGAVIVLAQVLGGVLAGMGGGLEMLGRYSTFSWSALPGYGWTGITIAILAGNNPIFVPFAAFFMAYLDKGCNLMSTYSGVPYQLIDIIQAVIFLFFAAEQFLSRYRQKLVVRSTQEELAQKAAAEEGGVKHV